MDTMLGNSTNSLKLVFDEMLSQPELSADPRVQHVPLEDLFLQRLRELQVAHRLLYTTNVEYIDNLNSRVQAATEHVSRAIIRVLGDTESAQQAAAAFRSCRMLETAEDVSRRTVKHPGEIHVCKEDPAVHEGLPKSVWESPDRDEIFMKTAASNGWTTVAEFEEALLYRHINRTFRPAITAQQHIIRCLVNVLSEQTVLTQLHRILRHQKVPKKIITLICAKVVGLQCHWTTEIPTHWLSEPVKARSSGQQPSCVVVEEPSCSNNNNDNNNTVGNIVGNNNNNSKGWRLFSVRVAKAVAAAGVSVASMLANRHGT